MAEYLEVKPNTFYLWISGRFNFGTAKERQLQQIIDTLRE